MKSSFFKLKPIFSGSLPRQSPDDFYIELNDPHKTYSPGDLVQGNVVLLLPKDQRVNLVSCTLCGEISIKNQLIRSITSKYLLFEDYINLWGPEESPEDSGINGDLSPNPSQPQSQSQLPSQSPRTQQTSVQHQALHPFALQQAQSSGSGSNESSLRSLSSATYESSTSVPVSPCQSSSGGSLTGSQLTLPKGEHSFAFEFELPKSGLFNSLEFERGSILYTLTAVCKRPSVISDLIAKRNLSVIVPIDVSKLPKAKNTSLTVEVRRKRKEKGSIVVAVKMNQRGYLRGETIPVKINIQHIQPLKSVAGVVTTLSRISRMSAEGLEAQSFRKDLHQTISPLYTDPVTFAASITANIKIPADTFPTTKGHKVISFQYCIEVVIDLEGKWDLKRSDMEHAHSSLKHEFIDTDKLKRGRGVVSLWTEVVIGTFRSGNDYVTASATASPVITASIHRPPPAMLESRSRSTTSSTGRDSSLHSTASSLNNYYIAAGSGSGSTSQNGFAVQLSNSENGNGNATGTDDSVDSEKERMRQFEQALLPSEPTLNGQSRETSLPPLYANAPPHPSSHHGSSHGDQHVAPVSDDKLELERYHLEQQSNDPYYLPPLTEDASSSSYPSAPPHPGDGLPPLESLTIYEDDHQTEHQYEHQYDHQYDHQYKPELQPSAPPLPPPQTTLPSDHEHSVSRHTNEPDPHNSDDDIYT